MNLKKKTMIVIFLVMVTLGTSAFAYSQDWPMLGHDPQNTGYTSSNGPSTGELQWVYTTEGIVLSSPVVVDGKVYIGSEDGKIYCLNADTGDQIWDTQLGSFVTHSPAVAYNRVYISSDMSLYCLNADTGELIWEQDTDTIPYSPTVAYGMVFVACYNDKVLAFDWDSGDPKGEYQQIDQIPGPPVSPIYASPAVADGKVFIPLYLGKVGVWDLGSLYPSGGFLPAGVNLMSSPAVADDKIYIGSGDGKVYCYYTEPPSDPSVPIFIWDYQTGDNIITSPAVADGEVYVCTAGGNIFCLDAYKGNLVWEYTHGIGPGFDLTSSPAVVDNKVYIGSNDGFIYCLNADTGDLLWDYFIEDEIRSSPAVADGKVYIASYSGNVYCFGSTLDERIASLEDENAALEAENAALRSDLDALNTRMSETEIKFTELPGKRLNIYSETVGEYTISADETTHVWHGFVSNPWSDYTEEQKTEYLSTAQWRFTVDGEEVPLDHVLRLKGDYMWSIYYRVFPPGYFKIGSHRLVGEWHSMEDGEWDSIVREAKLRVK